MKQNLLQRIFQAPEFIKCLGESIKLDKSKRIESGFNIYRNFNTHRLQPADPEFIVGALLPGGVGMIKGEDMGRIHLEGFPGFFSFAYYHIHGGWKYYILHSKEDIITLNFDRTVLYEELGIAAKPISIVGVYENEDIYLNIMQEATKIPVPEMTLMDFADAYISDVKKYLCSADCHKKIEEYVNSSMLYKNKIIKLEGGMPDPDSLDKLSIFDDAFSINFKKFEEARDIYR